MESCSIENLIIDTDIGDGIDDSFGIVGAQLSTGLTIRAVVTCWGNVVKRARLARMLLDSCGGSEIPVFAGEGRSMSSNQEIKTSFDSGHGVLNPSTEIDSRPGVKFMLDSVLTNPQQLSIVAIGPLTNIACCIQADPAFSSNLKQLIVMGGRLPQSMHLEERNFDDDPVATEIVLNSSADLLIVPFEPSSTVLIGDRELHKLQSSDTKCCRLLAVMLRQYLAVRHRKNTPLFDLATIGCLDSPELARIERSHLSMTKMGDRVRLVEGRQLTARLTTQFDGARYMTTFMDRVLDYNL
tara:strand:- start:7046 stop:7936 length:891 start_codon:yes stop_codon:yes gene_type:complete